MLSINGSYSNEWMKYLSTALKPIDSVRLQLYIAEDILYALYTKAENERRKCIRENKSEWEREIRSPPATGFLAADHFISALEESSTTSAKKSASQQCDFFQFTFNCLQMLQATSQVVKLAAATKVMLLKPTNKYSMVASFW